MLTIRLQRTGKRNTPHFRVVLAQHTTAAGKSFVELLGSYSAKTKELVISNSERLQYWIEKNTRMSPTVHNLLITKGFLKADKVSAFSIPKKPVEAVKEESVVAPKEAPVAEPAPAADVVTEEPPAVAETTVAEAPVAAAPAEEPVVAPVDNA